MYEANKHLNICMLTGGTTGERNVALAGAYQVVQALRSRGHIVNTVDTVNGPLDGEHENLVLRTEVGLEPPSEEELRSLADRENLIDLVGLPELKNADVVFVLLHGRQGEGGTLQALLDTAGICFTGSGFFGSALAMEKTVSKSLFAAHGVPTPNWKEWPASEAEIEAIGLPCVVKPSRGGSTIGLTVVRSAAELRAAVRTAQIVDDIVLVEQYIAGREFTVGVLGDQSLAVGEIIPEHGIFDYVCKYTPGKSVEVFPADLPESIAARMRDYAWRAHKALHLDDFSRVDFMLSENNEIYCLEANTLPGMTPTSLLPQSAAVFGIDFPTLCEQICTLALARRHAHLSSGVDREPVDTNR